MKTSWRATSRILLLGLWLSSYLVSPYSLHGQASLVSWTESAETDMLSLYACEAFKSTGDTDPLSFFVDSYALWLELVVKDQWSQLDDYKTSLKSARAELSHDDTAQSQYLLADLLLHDAVIDLLRDRRWSGLRKLHRVYDALIDLEIDNPQALDVQKSLGVIEWLVSQMTPSQQRWVKRLTSLDGDREVAISRLVRATEQADVMGMEASIALCLIYAAEDPIMAEEALDGLPIQGGLIALIRAGVDLQHGRPADAITLLDRYTMDLSKWYFLHGKADLYTENYDSAHEHFIRSTQLNQGPHLEAQVALYQYWLQLLTTADPPERPDLSGDYVIDADLAALDELRSADPHPQILRGRLAQDAGRYDQSITILTQIDTSLLTSEYTEEHAYRLARAYQKAGDTAQALLHLTAFVDDYHTSREYYRSAALIALAELYMTMDDQEHARLCAEECLDSKPNRHAQSLHREARELLEEME